jgi:hypothetical protein
MHGWPNSREYSSFVGAIVLAVKRNPHEAALQHVAAPDVHFDRAFAKIAPLDPGDAVVRLFRQMHASGRALKRRHFPVDGPQLLCAQALARSTRWVAAACGSLAATGILPFDTNVAATMTAVRLRRSGAKVAERSHRSSLEAPAV